MESHLQKLREERMAREKARIEKLRELNLQKYSKNDCQVPKSSRSTISNSNKAKPEISSLISATKSKSDTHCITKNKNHLRRPITAPTPKNSPNKDITKVSTKVMKTSNGKQSNKLNHNNIKETVGLTKDKVDEGPKATEKNDDNISENIPKIVTEEIPNCTNETSNKSTISGGQNKNPLMEMNAESQTRLKKSNLKISPPVQKSENKNVNGIKTGSKNIVKIRQSIAAMPKIHNKQNKAVDNKQNKLVDKRKTMLPVSKPNSNITTESVFDRLSKPKIVHKQPIDNVIKHKTDPEHLKKTIKNSEMIAKNRRQTTFEQKKTVRRSISAIHFKRIRQSEITNCVHKWASIGNNIDKQHFKDINEDESIKDEKVISAVKSERKRVKFQTPVPLNLNTPKPGELQQKLQNWLEKRGKKFDSYHHLQCFGIHHLSNDTKYFHLEAPDFNNDDENKENIALDHDSDNESYLENNNHKGSLDVRNQIDLAEQKWRRISSITETSDINESSDTTLTPGNEMHHIDELLLGSLSDLTEILREGFDWEQCLRWLRAILERFPSATDSAAYWECRAALEERRGDLNATIQCLEQSIAKGTEQSIVEANLDSLLDKFMHLKISPSAGRKQVDPKLVDVKNVFKSTIIRFAVQQAKLSQSTGTPKFTVTPVRRSHRLSRIRTPLSVCTTVHQAKELGAEFKPNKALLDSP